MFNIRPTLPLKETFRFTAAPQAALKLLVSLGVALSSLAPMAEPASVDRGLLLADNGQAAQATVDMLRTLDQPIFNVYEMHLDPFSLTVMAMLRTSARAGRRPTLLVDAVGVAGIPKQYFRYLVSEGVRVAFFRPPLSPMGWLRGGIYQVTMRMHDKVITGFNSADGTMLAIAKQRNTSFIYHGFGAPGSQLIDVDFMFAGPATVAARQYQEELLASNLVQDVRGRVRANEAAKIAKELDGYTTIYEDMGVVDLTHATDWKSQLQPMEKIEFIHDIVGKKGTVEGSERLFIDSINRAKTSIYLENQYLILTPDIERAMANAESRGVEIHVLTNGRGAYANFADRMAVNAYIQLKDRLRTMGVTVYEYHGPGKIHSKSAVIDGRESFIWSYNLDPRSNKLNHETGVRVTDSQVAELLFQTIQARMNTSTLVIRPKEFVHGKNDCLSILQRAAAHVLWHQL